MRRHFMHALKLAATAFKVGLQGWTTNEWSLRSESGTYVAFRVSEWDGKWHVSTSGVTYGQKFDSPHEAIEFARTAKCFLVGDKPPGWFVIDVPPQHAA